MTTLDRYIRASIIKGFVLVMLLLLCVLSFLEFVEELDNAGTGYYGLSDAFVYVLLTLPERGVVLVPITALLGCLLGLGGLDHNKELVAMRAAGVSTHRIGWSALKTGLLIVVLVVILAEFVVPNMAQHAWRQRNLALSGDISVRTESGSSFWFRDGQRFIRVRDMVYGRIPTHIEIYEFDETGELSAFTHAREAEPAVNGEWLLKDVAQKFVTGTKIEAVGVPTLRWASFLSPEQGAVMELDINRLAPSDLYNYARDLRARGQNAERYELALWRKINIPLATCAMIFIAIPFIFGALKLAGTGQRVMAGSGVGVAFYLSDQIIAQAGLLLGLNPALTATAPVALLLVAGLVLLQRID